MSMITKRFVKIMSRCWLLSMLLLSSVFGASSTIGAAAAPKVVVPPTPTVKASPTKKAKRAAATPLSPAKPAPVLDKELTDFAPTSLRGKRTAEIAALLTRLNGVLGKIDRAKFTEGRTANADFRTLGTEERLRELEQMGSVVKLYEDVLLYAQEIENRRSDDTEEALVAIKSYRDAKDSVRSLKRLLANEERRVKFDQQNNERLEKHRLEYISYLMHLQTSLAAAKAAQVERMRVRSEAGVEEEKRHVLVDDFEFMHSLRAGAGAPLTLKGLTEEQLRDFSMVMIQALYKEARQKEREFRDANLAAEVEGIRARDEEAAGKYWSFGAAGIGAGLMTGLRQQFPSKKEFEEVARWIAKRLAEGFIDVLNEQGAHAMGDIESVLQDQINELTEAAAASVRMHAEGITSDLREDLDATMQDARQQIGETVEEGRRKFLTAQDQVMKKGIALGSVGIVTWGSAALGMYAAYRVLAHSITKWQQPALIEKGNIPVVGESLRKMLRGNRSLAPYPLLSDVVLDVPTAQEFQTLKFAINNVKKTRGIFRNLLLWGYPGTGKTMSAEALANETDCYWALITGSSLFKMAPEQALQELDTLFALPEKLDKPLMLIIDEADTLFRDRTAMSEGSLKVLTHAMQKMGTESNKLIIVAVTNQPAIFDEAIRSRFPKQLEVRLPNMEQRLGIIKKYIAREFTARHSDGAVFDKELTEWIAAQTKGFSGRSLMFLVAGIRDAIAASGVTKPTQEFVRAQVIKEVEGRSKAEAGFTREVLIS